MTNETFKWDTPQDWLFYRIRKAYEEEDLNSLRAYAIELVYMTDSEKIHEHFHYDMDEDEYFDPILEGG